MWARGYSQMLAARAVVGLGEAGYGSVGVALIASHFPSRMHGALLAAFFASASVGSVLGVMLGGVIAAKWGWQAAFGVVGIPGLLLFVWLHVRCLRSARAVERRGVADPRFAHLAHLAGGVQASLIAFGIAALFHPIAYQFYFFSVAGLAVALKNTYKAEAFTFAPPAEATPSCS